MLAAVPLHHHKYSKLDCQQLVLQICMAGTVQRDYLPSCESYWEFNATLDRLLFLALFLSAPLKLRIWRGGLCRSACATPLLVLEKPLLWKSLMLFQLLVRWRSDFSFYKGAALCFQTCSWEEEPLLEQKINLFFIISPNPSYLVGQLGDRRDSAWMSCAVPPSQRAQGAPLGSHVVLGAAVVGLVPCLHWACPKGGGKGGEECQVSSACHRMWLGNIRGF